MITEDYVSFEIEKLLKEKGFDEEECEVHYDPEDHTQYEITLQMAMKWLREVHKIFLSINFIPEHFCFTYRIVHNGVEEKFVVYSSTYNEACEAAIKYCLENLV